MMMMDLMGASIFYIYPLSFPHIIYRHSILTNLLHSAGLACFHYNSAVAHHCKLQIDQFVTDPGALVGFLPVL